MYFLIIKGSHLSLEPVVTFIPQMASATFQSSDMILIQATKADQQPQSNPPPRYLKIIGAQAV